MALVPDAAFLGNGSMPPLAPPTPNSSRRDAAHLRLSMPMPVSLMQLRARRMQGRRRVRSTLGRTSSRSLPLSGPLISLHGAPTAMPAQGQLFAEEINCVYTRQNCTCEFNCPCEVNGEDSHEALWCGCEQLYNCTCEMRSGACTLGPPDDAYLYFPGTLNGTGGYLAGLRGEAMDFAPNASYTIEAWVRPYKQSADVPQTLVSRFNNQV